MSFEISDQVRALNAQLQHFMDEHIHPREREWHEWCHDPEHLWEVPAWYDDIRDKALSRMSSYQAGTSQRCSGS